MIRSVKYMAACFCLLIFLTSESAKAKVELPAVISNGMVLQQNSNAALWGRAKPGKMLRITTSWDKKVYQTSVSTDGKWTTKVKTPKAGGPYEITFDDGDTFKLDNILIGEVWLASGQSNMEMPLKGFNNQPVLGSDQAISMAKNPQIRFFQVKNVSWKKPLENCEAAWVNTTPISARDFSAVAYFYAKILNEKLNVPIGIIQADWGGTVIEAWMSKESLSKFSNEIKVPAEEDAVNKNKNTPSGLYNAMIKPVEGYGIKGVIWYQGESNRNKPDLYAKLFPAMVKQWRSDWKTGDFAFYFAQIAPYISNSATLTPALQALEPKVPVLREVQLQSLNHITNSGMAVLTDIGAENTIHPPDKENVGKRLSYLALANTYGNKKINWSGPTYKSMQVQDGKILLKFTAAEGLKFSGNESANFEVAGSDKVFHPAKASITKDGILVSATEVSKPVAARYAFKAWTIGDLFNKYDLPASSFRTDSWEIK
ncbi:MAG: sialate O-acetylesterase [Pedobacter sp.]|uniref:sialate O-acetylesterase n=1 Tax=Pedobacter sp. TaxID=1411316 RepID=UPI0035614897